MIDDRNQETGSKCFINTERFACLNTVAQRSQVIVRIREAEFLHAQIFRNGKEVIDKDLILAGLVNVKCQQTFARINKTTCQIIDRIRIGNNHLIESLCLHFFQNFIKSLCVHHDVLLINRVAVTVKMPDSLRHKFIVTVQYLHSHNLAAFIIRRAEKKSTIKERLKSAWKGGRIVSTDQPSKNERTFIFKIRKDEKHGEIL